MPVFSDYVIYVDESGDHDLDSVSDQYSMFVLAFCIFKKRDYITYVVPELQKFKFNWFGHDMVVLHEYEIRKQKVPFKFLQIQNLRNEFMRELSEIFQKCPATVVSSVIDKRMLKNRYAFHNNPYHIALRFCMERTHRFLIDNYQKGTVTHVIFEKRGGKEDQKLELEFRRIKDGANYTGINMEELDICLVDKKANSSGLQIADLFARPIGLRILRPDQLNRAYDIIVEKFRKSPRGNIIGFGLKVFP